MSNDQKKKKTGRQNYDWNRIMTEYVTESDSSLRKIAAKYGIRFTTVQNKSKADSWFAAKQEYQKKIRSKAIAKAVTKKADALAKELESVDKMSSLISKMMKDELQFNRHLVMTSSMDETGQYTTTEEKVFDKVDARAVKDILSSLKLIEDMKRSMMEEQRIETRQKYDLEKARLELERERFEFEKQKAELLRPDGTNIIRIDGIEKGWTE